MYAGDKPQKQTRIIFVNCWEDYHTVKRYKEIVEGLMNECEK